MMTTTTMDREQTLHALLSTLSAVAHLNSTFSHVLAAYVRRRNAIVRAICEQSCAPRRSRPRSKRRSSLRPARSSCWWDRFAGGAAAPEEWHENFRMSRATLTELSERLRPHVQGTTTNMKEPVDVLRRVACTVFYLSHRDALRSVAAAFGLSRQAVSVIIRRVCRAVSAHLGPELIRGPRTEAEVRSLVENFQRTHGFPQCLGAIHSTRIDVRRDRGGTWSLAVQAVCDYRCRFLDVHVKLPAGGVQKVHVSSDSELMGALENRTIPPCPRELVPGEASVPVFLLGGPGHSLRPHLMTEYPDGGATPAEQRYGRRLAEARAVISRAYGRVRSRFATLTRPMDINRADLPAVVHACFVLHNFCELHGEPVDEQSVHTLLLHDHHLQPPCRAGATEGERVRRVLTAAL